MTVAVLVVAWVCVVWAVVAALLIAADRRRRGAKVSYVWLRLFILRYLFDYRRMTRQETGRTGLLFYHYVVPLNVALLLSIILGVRSCR